MIEDETYPPENSELYFPSKQRVDTTILVICVIHVLMGVIATPIVILLFSSGILQTQLLVAILILIEGAILIISIPLYFILAWAIWKRMIWVWKTAVLVNGIFLLLNLFGQIILLTLLNIILIFSLYSPEVRRELTEN